MRGLAFLLTGSLLSFSLPQENRQTGTDWGQIRKSFDIYCSSPTNGNAEKVLSALPNRIDYKTTDFDAMNSNVIGVYEDHITDLYELVKKGDRFALRITFSLRKFTDGFYAEMLTALIGDSIVVMPSTFLEETLLFRKNNPREINDFRFYVDDEFLTQILCGYIDFDSFRPEVIKKEINSRIKALESVDRKDLLEIRDDCLSRLRDYLKKVLVRSPGLLLPQNKEVLESPHQEKCR